MIRNALSMLQVPENIVSVHLMPNYLSYLEMTSDLSVINWKLIELVAEERYSSFFAKNHFHKRVPS